MNWDVLHMRIVCLFQWRRWRSGPPSLGTVMMYCCTGGGSPLAEHCTIKTLAPLVHKYRYVSLEIQCDLEHCYFMTHLMDDFQAYPQTTITLEMNTFPTGHRESHEWCQSGLCPAQVSYGSCAPPPSPPPK